MLSSLGVSESLSKAEVNHVQQMLFFVYSYQEVIRLHVSMQEMVVMQELNPLHHLVSQHQHCLQRKLPLAEGHEILQAGTQQVHDHRVIVTLHSEPVDRWNTNYHMSL